MALMVTETRDLQQVELCLTQAFKYLGGVPHEILFDNMRSIIDKARTQYSDTDFCILYYQLYFSFRLLCCIIIR